MCSTHTHIHQACTSHPLPREFYFVAQEIFHFPKFKTLSNTHTTNAQLVMLREHRRESTVHVVSSGGMGWVCGAGRDGTKKKRSNQTLYFITQCVEGG